MRIKMLRKMLKPKKRRKIVKKSIKKVMNRSNLWKEEKFLMIKSLYNEKRHLKMINQSVSRKIQGNMKNKIMRLRFRRMRRA
jgi:hypothetical protein